jgi:hypothetical protein
MPIPAAVSHLSFQTTGQRLCLEAVTFLAKSNHSKEPPLPTASPIWKKERKHIKTVITLNPTDRMKLKLLP